MPGEETRRAGKPVRRSQARAPSPLHQGRRGGDVGAKAGRRDRGDAAPRAGGGPARGGVHEVVVRLGALGARCAWRCSRWRWRRPRRGSPAGARRRAGPARSPASRLPVCEPAVAMSPPRLTSTPVPRRSCTSRAQRSAATALAVAPRSSWVPAGIVRRRPSSFSVRHPAGRRTTVTGALRGAPAGCRGRSRDPPAPSRSWGRRRRRSHGPRRWPPARGRQHGTEVGGAVRVSAPASSARCRRGSGCTRPRCGPSSSSTRALASASAEGSVTTRRHVVLQSSQSRVAVITSRPTWRVSSSRCPW